MLEGREEGGRVAVRDVAEGSGGADADPGGGPQPGTTRCCPLLSSGRLLELKKAFQACPPPHTPCIRLPNVGELAQQGWAGRGPALEPRDSTAGWVCS